VHVSWIWNPHPNPNDENSNTIMRYNFYISDDKTLDNYFLQNRLLLDWEDVTGCGVIEHPPDSDH